MNQQALMKLKKMQKQMEDAQKELEATTFTGTAGGGMVTIEMKGDHTVTKVTIDKDAVESKDDIEMLEDTLVAAINDVIKKIEDTTQKTMGAFTGGFPGMF